MTPIRFARFRLRTTEIDRAREFYAALFGDDEPLDIVALPADAIARGARPHWLGHLTVDDVEVALAAFVSRGAMQLGPTRPNERGGAVAIVRDAGGAIVALESQCDANRAPNVVWHGLNTNDAPRAIENYGALCGWRFLAPIDVENAGTMVPFAWDESGTPVGSVTGIEHRRGVHPHWLFHFAVKSLDRAMDVVRERGGLVLGPFVSPSGDRIAVCDDPQGAAFAMRVAG